jgi:hypothetical protein
MKRLEVTGILRALSGVACAVSHHPQEAVDGESVKTIE